MQTEIIAVLVIYLFIVFGLSFYAMRQRSSGTFLSEYFLGSRSMGGFVLAMTLTAISIKPLTGRYPKMKRAPLMACCWRRWKRFRWLIPE